jgi:hypothetical protein
MAQVATPSTALPLSCRFLAICLVVGGCNADSGGLTFIVPDNFRGPFTVAESPDGQQVDAASQWCRISVPLSGEVQVVSFEFLTQMRLLRCETTSGKVIPVSENSSDQQVTLHSFGFHSRNGKSGKHIYFVGTKPEADLWWGETY